MKHRTKDAFLIGLIGFPLSAGIAFVSIMDANLSEPFSMLFSMLFIGFWSSIFVLPLYLLIGCPIWYFLHRKKVTEKKYYLLITGFIAIIAGSLFFFKPPWEHEAYTGFMYIVSYLFKALLQLLPLILSSVFVAYLMWKVGIEEKAPPKS